MRTFNSLRNVIVGILYLVVKMIFDFLLRTVFIKTLGATYLGVNGLFSNILLILSLAELGVGKAIIFNLYKPVANRDIPKIRSLMKFYKKCYNTIGTGIFIAGLCLMPFLDVVIKYDAEAIEHIRFIFLLYLINSASSYFMVYKTNLVTVYEKNFITNIIKMISEVIMVIVQMIILVVFKNFYLYLAILIGNTIFTNFVNSKYAEKLYPEELDLKNTESIPEKEKKNIFKDVYALMLYRVGGVVSNGTSNIIISSFVGLSAVGLYSNYTLLVNAANKLLTNIFNGIIASLGNLNATDNKERSLSVFYQLNFMNFYLYGLCSVGIFCVAQSFITFWIGEQYLLSTATLAAIVLNFYIYGLSEMSTMYRNTLGLFVKGKYRPIIGASINITLSIMLATRFGVSGILFAGAISNLVTTIWYDPKMILKYGFGKTPWKYYTKQISYIITIVLSIVISLVLSSFIKSTSLVWLIARSVICVVVFNILVILFYFRTSEFKGLIKTVMSLKMLKKG